MKVGYLRVWCSLHMISFLHYSYLRCGERVEKDGSGAAAGMTIDAGADILASNKIEARTHSRVSPSILNYSTDG
jgi:hypothetical protein